MNTKHTLLFTLGLASSLALAQSQPPASPSAGDGPPVDTSGYQSGSGMQMPSSSGEQSEGTSGYPYGPATQMPSSPGEQSEGASGYQSGPATPMPSSSGEPGQVEPGAPMQERSEMPSSGASAGEYDPETRPAPAPMTKVEPISEGGFTYLCGGVGADEAAQMKQEARDYDMMLTFASRKGDYLADVNVDIRDAQGKSLLKTTCDAPIMLVDFPASGTYRIHAETGGYSLDRTARVATETRSPVAMVMSWPQQVAEAPTPAPATTSVGDSAGNDSEASGVEEDENSEDENSNNGNMR